jgi:hypothetical protein
MARNDRVAGILSRRECRNHQSSGFDRRHVFRGMHSDVDLALEERLLQCGCEYAAPANRHQRRRLVDIALWPDHMQVDGQIRTLRDEEIADGVCLPQGKGTTACSDHESRNACLHLGWVSDQIRHLACHHDTVVSSSYCDRVCSPFPADPDRLATFDTMETGPAGWRGIAQQRGWRNTVAVIY